MLKIRKTKGEKTLKIEINIECRSCGGTGVYVGIGEREGAAVVCHTCKGTGCDCISPNLKDWKPKTALEPIDMSKEGVSYEEFLQGAMPKPIKKIGCPMIIDQGACHEKKKFIDKADCPFGTKLSDCRKQPINNLCWELFDSIK